MFGKAFTWVWVFALLVAVCASSEAAPSARRVALVVGNGDYANNTRLPNPPNDARAVSAALRRLGFEVEEIIDADRADMEHIARRFARKVKSADVGLLFYAGHGLQIDGENYLVPVDATFDQDFVISKQLIGLSRYLRAMEKGPKVSLVFLDACRDNPLAEFLKRGVGSGARKARSVTLDGARVARSVGQGLAELQGNVGSLIAYATQPGNVAEDGGRQEQPVHERDPEAY